MKKSKGTWLILLSLALALGLNGPMPARAQTPADTNVEANDSASKQAEMPEVKGKTNATESDTSAEQSPKDSSTGVNRGPIVMFGQNVELKAGDTAEVVVVIGGSAKIHGHVRETVVTIGGDIEVDGTVGEEVVAVMGSVHALPGAQIKGDVVSVGGTLHAEEGAKIRGQTQEVAIGGLRFGHADWAQKWLSSCVFMLRPLSPTVGWVWIVALVHLLLFLFIGAVFRTPVQACMNELTRRPATTFLTGLLTKMLLPLIIIILIVLVVGIVVVPFLVAAMLVLSLVGKVAVLESIGGSVGRIFGKRPIEAPIAALLIGSAILALLYMIPVVGLLTMLLLSVWSLGCGVTAAFRGFRREMPEGAPKRAEPAYAPLTAAVPGAASNPSNTGSAPYSTGGVPPTISPAPGFSAQASSDPAGPAMASASGIAPEPPVMSDVLVYPKATFWERIGATFLDLILVLILGSVVRSLPFTMIIGLAYVSAMWTWKGTTIGGIVLGLKVVRMDGQPVTFAVALVRGLAAAFSAIVLFLGFIWIAWDPDKQGWHDRIAGTYVLKLPRGTPLLCF